MFRFISKILITKMTTKILFHAIVDMKNARQDFSEMGK